MPSRVTKKYKPKAGAKAKLMRNMRKRMIQTGKTARTLVQERVSKKSMSRGELERKDHPYASRHGKILSGNKSPTQYVGKNSGAISGSLKGRTKGTKNPTYTIGFTNSPPRHSQFIFFGTRVMLPRSPLDVLREQNSTNGFYQN